MLAGCTSQSGSADALQKACVDTTASAIKLIDAADSCGAGFVEAVFTTEAASTGIAGADGVNGVNGVDGHDGTNGTNGSDGAAGANGLNGADGANGLNGSNGLDGADGTNGHNGADGLDGAEGTDGADGAVGPMGPRGPVGETGAVGAQGIQGLTGATGAQGPAGNSLLAAEFGTRTGGARDSLGNSCTLGTLSLTASTYAGNGLVADGRLLPIATYSALFSLIGTTYGGDGRVTFGLPDMSDITPNDMTWMICHQGIFPSPL